MSNRIEEKCGDSVDETYLDSESPILGHDRTGPGQKDQDLGDKMSGLHLATCLSILFSVAAKGIRVS
jgi:hypothetical protein